MKVEFNNLFLATINGKEEKILVLYNLSSNHYVALIVTDNPIVGKKSKYIAFLNKYADFSDVIDVARKEIKSPIYSKGKILSVDEPTRNFITKRIHNEFVDKIHTTTNHRIPDDLSFLKWTCKKLRLNASNKTFDIDKLRPLQICWIDFGFNIGSELRKIRPGILWRSSGDKRMWTIIPLSTKCNEDNYYFHHDITSINDCSAKIESMMNLSVKRVLEPYYSKDKIAYLNGEDYSNIKSIIKRYYTFEKE